MSIGVVTAFETSRNGKAKIKIDNTWMFAGRCNIDGLTVGAKVEYVAEEFGSPGQNGKRPVGLQKWRPVVNGAGEPQTGSTVTEADILRSISNVVGSACAAGMVKEPKELGAWFAAAFLGFTRLEKTLEAARNLNPEEDPDDSGQLEEEMPDSFYQGLPPPKNNSGAPW